jgi:uncharacterized protein (DUF486 family)
MVRPSAVHGPDRPLVQVTVASWLIALAEYCFQVLANRIGYGEFSDYQLKIISGDYHTDSVCGFRLFCLREAPRWNYLLFGRLLGAFTARRLIRHIRTERNCLLAKLERMPPSGQPRSFIAVRLRKTKNTSGARTHRVQGDGTTAVDFEGLLSDLPTAFVRVSVDEIDGGERWPSVAAESYIGPMSNCAIYEEVRKTLRQQGGWQGTVSFKGHKLTTGGDNEQRILTRYTMGNLRSLSAGVSCTPLVKLGAGGSSFSNCTVPEHD